VTKVLFSVFKKAKMFLTGKGVERVPGVLWVYKILLRWLVPKGTVLIEVQGNKMYVDSKDKAVAVPLLIDSYETYETALFNREIRENMVVVDIGANIGYYSLIAGRLVGNGGKVYAFEPEPANYQTLIRHIQINGYTNIFPVQKAISNQCGKTELFLSEVNLGEPSLCERNISKKAGFLQVETITLDEFFQDCRVDFIKIDAQGAEGRILEGAQQVLKDSKLKIMMEFWPDGLKNMGTDPLQLLQRMLEAGFKIEVVGKANQPSNPAEIMESIKSGKKGEYLNLLFEK
jgi:FkbM family methyltransferase